MKNGSLAVKSSNENGHTEGLKFSAQLLPIRKSHQAVPSIASDDANVDPQRKPDRLTDFRSSGISASVQLQDSPPAQKAQLSTSNDAVAQGVTESMIRSLSLWHEALKKLDPEKQSAIRGLAVSVEQTSSPAGLIENVYNDVREKRSQCEAKRWKLSFRGREVILRDVADKVATRISKFKEIGDVVANVDPLHAGLPWAGMRFVLQLIVAEKDQNAALLLSLDKISYLISRCKVYEGLYLSRIVEKDIEKKDAASGVMRTALLSMYQQILAFLGSAILLYSKHTAGRIAHALMSTKQLDDSLKVLEQSEQQLETEAENCERIINRSAHESQAAERERLRAILNGLQEPILRIDETVCELLQTVKENELHAALTFVSSVPYEDHHALAIRNRTPNTGRWLLMDHRYYDWRDSSASMFLWLHGIRKLNAILDYRSTT